MTRTLNILGLALTFASAPAARAQPSIGERPPALSLEETMQAPEGQAVSWEALTGKVVVLEFWATWCGPCLAAFPHLNSLAEEFSGRPVVFLSITDEPRATVENKLRTRPLKTWIGLDTDRSVIGAFGVRSIPHTVLIGADGRVAAVTHPTSVTPELLTDLIAGRPVHNKLAPTGAPLVAGEEPATLPDRLDGSAARLVIAPTDLEGGGTASNNAGLTAESWTIRQAVGALADLPEGQIELADGVPPGRYTFVARCPAGRGGWRPLLRLGIEQTFGLEIVNGTAERDTWVLRPAAGGPRGFVNADPAMMMSMSTGPSMIRVENGEAHLLARWLGERLGTPVLDESGVKGPRSYTLTLPEATAEAAAAALRETLGLSLVRERREVEIVAVRPRAQAASEPGAGAAP